MDNDGLLSSVEVAEILGVGVSTVKTLGRRDILPAMRTCGGHRRILLADRRPALARLGRLPDVDLARLPLMVE